MQIYIPKLGDHLIIEQDWSFTLYDESRNTAFLEKVKDEGILGKKSNKRNYNQGFEVTLLRGRSISVRRIYIRCGKGEYDSITFTLLKEKTSKMHGRFWVTLDDANQLHAYPIDAPPSTTIISPVGSLANFEITN